jgi:hypothetical protein
MRSNSLKTVDRDFGGLGESIAAALLIVLIWFMISL